MSDDLPGPDGELLSLDDWLSPAGSQEAQKQRSKEAPDPDPNLPSGFRASLLPSFPALSRRHAEHLVGYGFFAPDGDASGSWTVAPSDCFRATKIYVWPRHAERASIESLCFGSDEQLIEGSSLPADLFASWVTPRQFLSLYAGLEDFAPGFHRVLLKHLPAQPNYLVPLDFPTLSIGMPLSIRWTGSLTALFVCGRELVPQRREEAQKPGSKEAPDPETAEPPA